MHLLDFVSSHCRVHAETETLLLIIFLCRIGFDLVQLVLPNGSSPHQLESRSPLDTCSGRPPFPSRQVSVQWHALHRMVRGDILPPTICNASICTVLHRSGRTKNPASLVLQLVAFDASGTWIHLRTPEPNSESGCCLRLYARARDRQARTIHVSHSPCGGGATRGGLLVEDIVPGQWSVVTRYPSMYLVPRYIRNWPCSCCCSSSSYPIHFFNPHLPPSRQCRKSIAISRHALGLPLSRLPRAILFLFSPAVQQMHGKQDVH